MSRSKTRAAAGSSSRRKPADTPRTWRKSILEYIAEHPDRPVKTRALARELDVSHDAYADFRELIRALLDDGELALGPGRTLALPERGGRLRGRFRAHADGYGFIIAEGRPDVFVPPGHTRDALDGDEVEYRLQRGGDPRRPPPAEITRVLKRATGAWVGVLERDGTRYFVTPRGKPGAPAVRIDDPFARGAHEGDLVVVDPHYHTQQETALRGAITERLGAQHSGDAIVRSVIRAQNLREDFPPDAMAEASRAADARIEDVPDREDLRDTLTITIDPPDARDFDDAISITRLAGGQWELGVHIADVAHFVPVGGPLDTEALLRGTSVYFPTRALPMLPEALSSDACSLRPGESRLAKSVFIRYGDEARPVSARFANSIIRSSARLTYDDAQELLSQGRGEGGTEPIRHLLHDAAELARRIRARRLRDGMISLQLPEAQLDIDSRGMAIASRPAEKLFAHTLIEMFMIEANEAVCRELCAAERPHLRRVHATPEREDVRRLRRILEGLGHAGLHTLDPAAIRALQDRLRGRPESNVINYLLLRAMPQAQYSAFHGGHFALASRHYCHFTSPIRRYPDLVNHRALDAHLTAPRKGSGGRRRSAKQAAAPIDDASLAEVATLCSASERSAQDAERQARALLQVGLYLTRIGHVFDAVVLGITPAGVFVQITDTLTEGFVPLASLGGGWEFDREAQQLRRRESAKGIHIGLALRVRVERIDPSRGSLVLSFAGRIPR